MSPEIRSLRPGRTFPRSGSILALTMAALLAGCAVGPDATSTDMAMPSYWHRAGAPRATTASVLGEWWRDLKDPTLDALIERAVDGNLDVKTAKARVREARALQRQAIGGMLPSLDGSATGLRQQTVSSTTGVTSVGSLFQTGFDAAWEVDLFGGNLRTAQAAGAGADAAEADLDSALLSLVGEVATDYVTLRGQQARAALARRTAQTQRETARLTRSKFEVGTASAVDNAKAEAAAATTEAAIPSLEAAEAATVHALSVLTGAEPGALIGDLARAGAIPAPRRALPAGIPADVLDNRPDVRAARLRVAQATAKLGASEAALYPSINLTGSISTAAIRPGDLAKTSTVTWSWGPTISVPIFEGGKLMAARDGAAATRDEYLVAYRAAVLTALEDVENALVASAKEKVRAGKLATAAAAYRRSAELSNALYASGSSSFLDVLDAQRSLYSAEDALILSRVAVATDHVALAKALGGGWKRPVDATRPEVVDGYTGPHLVGTLEPSGTPAR